MAISWTNDLDTGIPVIDEQHKQIVNYINKLEQAESSGDLAAVKQVVDECVNYTLSHFAFEESLQEDAGYQFARPHKKVHDLFTRRVNEYRGRLAAGENIAADLHNMLEHWLVNHIKHDDADYVTSVKASMDAIIEEKSKDGSWIKRFFIHTPAAHA